ncbi:hypothetical protein DY000_02047479 [Brassica cretica]|uniref:Uncharacterized protein n=1 Tax=Brassica cretica TaxID=69181 RepID=A0ABQ7F8N3_BRACR|nr:hypothetical protein DY000_02047479 [Brassica cretica]
MDSNLWPTKQQLGDRGSWHSMDPIKGGSVRASANAKSAAECNETLNLFQEKEVLYCIVQDIRQSSAFYQTLRDSSWKIIDAGETMEEVEKKIQQVVLDKVKECAQVKSFSLL